MTSEDFPELALVARVNGSQLEIFLLVGLGPYCQEAWLPGALPRQFLFLADISL